MIQVITAPSIEVPSYESVFLAGGITNCKDWQKDVIRSLESENITVFNPRQEAFDINDNDAGIRQIEWEFDRLEHMDIFSMYFCNSNSDQPICMYELGRNIIRMQNRFPCDWENRIVISVEDGYKRSTDVLVQTALCAPVLFVNTGATPESHAHFIRRAVRKVC